MLKKTTDMFSTPCFLYGCCFHVSLNCLDSQPGWATNQSKKPEAFHVALHTASWPQPKFIG